MKKKNILSLLLAVMIMMTCTVCVLAEPEDGDSADDTAIASGDYYLENDAFTPPDTSHAEAAILMDLKTGRCLYSKNADAQLYPASTTKIMTGILALEMGNMEDVVTATYEALKDITLEDSHMGILIGEELTFEQLVTGMMVYSANDAANVIAVHLAGSMDAFVELMNQKAQELGMSNTHFMNPCGIHDDNHYTSANDLAILAKYAMQNEKFREIVKMAIYKIPPTNKYQQERILVNTNLFLGTSRSTYYYYPPAIGIKTGHTSNAGYCLVSAAAYNDTELLAVVMNCPNTDEKENAFSYIDSKNLFDFGFDHYVYQQVISPGDVITESEDIFEAVTGSKLSLAAESAIASLLPADIDIATELITNISLPEQMTAPIKTGDIIGTVSYSYKGNEIGVTNLVATNDIARNEFLHIFHIVLKVITSPFFFIPAIVLIILAIIANHQRKKRQRQRRLRQLRKNKQLGITNDIGQRTPDRKTSQLEKNRNQNKNENTRYSKK